MKRSQRRLQWAVLLSLNVACAHVRPLTLEQAKEKFGASCLTQTIGDLIFQQYCVGADGKVTAACEADASNCSKVLFVVFQGGVEVASTETVVGK